MQVTLLVQEVCWYHVELWSDHFHWRASPKEKPGLPKWGLEDIILGLEQGE